MPTIPDSSYGPPAHELKRTTVVKDTDFPVPNDLPKMERVYSPLNFLDFDARLLLYKGVAIVLDDEFLMKFKKLAASLAIAYFMKDLDDDTEPKSSDS